MRLFIALLLALSPFSMVLAQNGSSPDAERLKRYSLTVHHFLGPTSGTHKDFLLPWAKNLEERSGGRLSFKIYPSMTLGGKPTDLYKQSRDGVADIVWTLAGYTPGQFPRTEVFELPFVHLKDAVATNKAIWAIYQTHLKDDYKDVHPLAIHVHAGQSFHMKGQPVRNAEGLQNEPIRTPNRVGGWFLDALGANPVGMPVPSLPQAMSKGVVAGALIPFEVSKPLRIYEIGDYGLLGHNSVRFGTAVFLLLMNPESYAKLPDDLRQLLDENSQNNLSQWLGELWMANEQEGLDAYENAKKPVLQVDEKDMGPFYTAGQIARQLWIDTIEPLGFDAKDLLSKAEDEVLKYQYTTGATSQD
jgi:TRAP-type C4-dicarboxylate transport system substrate-binding protein